MKRDTIEKWVLLKQSGELDLVRDWLLRRAMCRDAGARRFQDDLNRITAAARGSVDAVPGNSAALAAILSAAGKNSSRSEEFGFEPSRPAPAWRPALAFAALVLIAGATWLALQKPGVTPPIAQTTTTQPEQALPWDDGLDKKMDELNTMLAESSDEWDSTAGGSDLDTMAEELMQWEGSHI